MATFTDEVYALVRSIPKGKVMTYGDVATALGKQKAAIAVGNAMGRSVALGNVPWHRVVCADGQIRS